MSLISQLETEQKEDPEDRKRRELQRTGKEHLQAAREGEESVC